MRYVVRVRGLLIPFGLLLIVFAVLVGPPWLGPVGALVIVAGLALHFVRSEPTGRQPITVQLPVRGRWIAINSPADKVPSHGTRELGQSYAIDLVHVPDPEVTWRGVHWWPLARRPASFPAFGQPVLAPATGTVVRVSAWQRDHWSRNSPFGLIYLFPEMLVRSLLSAFGGHFVMGNHIVLALDDGSYAALAHLKRNSVRVLPGQRVQPGEQIAECGNSGNTSEPHLHFQLMDHPRPMVAQGLPFSFDRYLVDGELQTGVPANNQAITAPTVASPMSQRG